MQSYKSFKEISSENISLKFLFEKETKFLAHTHNSKKAETLHEHTSKVENNFFKLIEVHCIEEVIDNIIEKISFDNIDIRNYIKSMFLHTIILHDFGKTNPNFQVERMQNPLFSKDKTIKIGYEHSFISAYVFLNYYFDAVQKASLNQESKSILWAYSFLLSIPIIKHHSSFLQKNYNFSEEKTESIQQFIKILDTAIPYEFSKTFFINEHRLWEYFDDFIKDKNFDFFPLFALLKLNYSLLTASDYLATSQYMNSIELKTEDDFGLITSDFKARLIENFDNNKKTPWNGELVRNPQKYTLKAIDEIREQNNKNLNFLRQKLGAEVLINIEKDLHKKVFYIEAPTGGGKTNMSMIAIRKMLELFPEINKVLYVFPFTTLITQTAKAIKDTFQIDDDDHKIAQIHSKAGFQEKKYGNEIDAKYGKEKRNQIDNLFVNYPFSLMTHIKFFDILKSNKKDTNYLLHRLANSIVIIDELQAYNPDHWDKIKYFIAQYAELFNIRFIIMSATLPKIDEIELTDHIGEQFVPLIPNAKKYLQNPIFAGRVAINTDLLEKSIKLPELASIVFEKSKAYSKCRTDKWNGRVYTIIEFLFKKSASIFYEEVLKMESFFDEIFVLSGTILEPRRKYIIEFLKDSENRKKKILLITTQVVEAGVDIDMDLGFKNQSLIDSDEQLAGRINRNVNKTNCELYLFKHDKPKSIYGKDWRFEVTEKYITPNEVKEILTKKKFETLYKKVFVEIAKYNNSPIEMRAFSEYRNNFKRIDFNAIHQDFKLIDSANASIFVPENISIFCYSTTDKSSIYNFSEMEISLAKKNNCITEDAKVSGEKIWDLYISYISDFKKRFSIDLKTLNGVMSKFVFSIFMPKIEDLSSFIENFPDEFNNTNDYLLKLRKDKLKQIYSLEGGINQIELEKETKRTYDFI